MSEYESEAEHFHVCPGIRKRNPIGTLYYRINRGKRNHGVMSTFQEIKNSRMSILKLGVLQKLNSRLVTKAAI